MYLVLLLAVIVQSFAGFVLWRLLRPQSGWVELAGMSVVIGTLLAVFSGIVLQPLFGWGWALPGLVALIVWVLWLRGSSRFNSAEVEKADRPLAIAVVIGFALAVVSFGLSVPVTRLAGRALGVDSMATWLSLKPSVGRFPPSASLTAFSLPARKFTTTGWPTPGPANSPLHLMRNRSWCSPAFCR